MKILFFPKTFEKLQGIVGPLLDGHEIEVTDLSDIKERIRLADVLVTGPLDVDEELIGGASRLRLVHQWGVGVERIDLEACSRRGIAVCNVPSEGTGNAEGVAEIALMHMLLLSRRFERCQESIRKRRLFSPQGVALWKKRACVIGLGSVGRNIVTRLKGMGMNVTGVNRTERESFGTLGLDSFCSLDRLQEALPGCRFVIISLELNEETRGIAGEAFFSSMDPGSYLVNVARAELVSRTALENSLDRGHLAGAGFDVFWDEPADPQDPLLENPSFTLTPHIGGVTDEALMGVARTVADNISRLTRDLELMNRLDPGR
ncbi:MAG TPA: glyoxylate reductase [Synergistaceae bacterium]|jgi:phosphoglycerate dehydrogenase-like enzyme|nr:MAG: D-isomer specific 2-hydroxyacid dehydrogenase NAD-binding protein [Synergistales bacterium 57_84]KUK88292.1 MAG: D-isomer specific 2-hydroxyacid dehydrogenase NAD-binding protein [Synergistales bacterium 58_81]HBG14122.1 glyoxylate reductase [Synergistaceae bacterium]HQO82851.1 2-hydroxyacid dehydrogenase [Synergistales bacterium]HCP06946.1 glyoxylate reductase [Synergistaceae bacterium]